MKQRIFLAFRIREEEIVSELEAIQKKLQNLNGKAHITWSKSRAFHVHWNLLVKLMKVK